MNIQLDTLDRWAEQAHRVNDHLLAALTAFATNQPERALPHVQQAQTTGVLLQRSLVREGAMDPECRGRDRAEETFPGRQAEALPCGSPTLAARRYVDLLAQVAEACAQYEAERGIHDGMTEMYQDYASAVRLEVHGPLELSR